MATRFRLTFDTTAPAVSPALQTYTHSAPSTIRRQLLTADASTLTNFVYTPDAADHLVAGDSLLAQFVSDTMVSGITFTNADVVKTVIQANEALATNNLFLQLFVAVVSSDGATVQRVLRSKVAHATENDTAVVSRFLTTTQDGATYTTGAGDRLVVEYSVTGTPSAAAGTQGHNGAIRLGGSGGSGDLLENNTTTSSTTLNPWFEVVPTVTFGALKAPFKSPYPPLIAQ